MELKTLCKYIGISVALVILIALIVTFLLLHFLNNDEAVTFRPGPKLVIDQDGGADDAMAIFMVLLNEKYLNGPQVVGLTTVNGNVNESQVFSNTQRILDIANRRDVNIYRGATKSVVYTHPADFYYGYDGLGDLENVTYQAIEAQPQLAALALIDMSKKYEGELTVLSIGPVTNIALAITLDPMFISRLSQLYVAAGTIYGPSYLKPEFNARVDVEAYKIIANNAVPDKVTIIPFSQIIDSLNHTTRDWRENVLGAIPTEIMQALNGFERLTIGLSDKWHELDPSAMAIVLKENLVTEIKYSENSINLCGEQRGININNFTEINEANVRIIYEIDEEGTKDFLIKVFSSELPQK